MLIRETNDTNHIVLILCCYEQNKTASFIQLDGPILSHQIQFVTIEEYDGSHYHCEILLPRLGVKSGVATINVVGKSRILQNISTFGLYCM